MDQYHKVEKPRAEQPIDENEIRITGQRRMHIRMILNIMALSFDGSVMGTVETKMSEEGIGGFVTLKFWEHGPHNNDFTLSTVIYEPHRDAVVSTIVFHPSHVMDVSASYGGDFKVWVRNGEDKLIERSRCRWACHVVGSYRKKAMTVAAFSSDTSVLAVAAETVITLWDPEKNILATVIGSALGVETYIHTHASF